MGRSYPPRRDNAPTRDRATLAGQLTRTLLQNAALAGGPPATGSGLPGTTTGTGNPLTANLGNLIDLRASIVKRTEDTSLTIRTAEGDTVTLTSHSELESLKARLTYGPADAPAGGTTAPAVAPAKGDDDDDHDAAGVTTATLREITKIHMRRLPTPAPVVPPATGGLTVPGKGTVSTPPVAVTPANAKKPTAKPVPVASPVAPKLPEPAWKVKVFDLRLNSIVYVLYQRSLATSPTSSLLGAGELPAPSDSPITRP